ERASEKATTTSTDPGFPDRPLLRRDLRGQGRPVSQEAPTTRQAPVIPRYRTEAPVQAVPATPPHRPRARRSWAPAKALGAVLAVSVLITGAALPGISDAELEQVEAAATVDAQSYTAGEDIRVEVFPRGDFSATTEKEIAASRAKAIAAAVASGRPVS